jgi:hypothetical protein
MLEVDPDFDPDPDFDYIQICIVYISLITGNGEPVNGEP